MACLCIALAPGCERDAELKAEAGQLSRAIDELRSAANETKPLPLERLRKLPCSHADTCSVQSTCVAAYELFIGALDDVGEGKRSLSQGDGGMVPPLLREAAAKLERANGLTRKCTLAQGEIVRRFRLK